MCSESAFWVIEERCVSVCRDHAGGVGVGGAGLSQQLGA